MGLCVIFCCMARSHGEVQGPGMAAALALWRCVPWSRFWSVSAEPEGLLLTGLAQEQKFFTQAGISQCLTGDSLPWWEIVCGSELLLTCRIPAVGSDTVPLHLSCFSLQAISIWHKMAGIYWVWNKISLTWGYVRTFFKCGLVLALYPVIFLLSYKWIVSPTSGCT